MWVFLIPASIQLIKTAFSFKLFAVFFVLGSKLKATDYIFLTQIESVTMDTSNHKNQRSQRLNDYYFSSKLVCPILLSPSKMST